MTSTKMLLAITNYNQKLEVEDFLKKLSSYWPKENAIIIDDASTDDSDLICEKLGWKVIRQQQNKGNGAGIRTAIFYAKENNFNSILLMSSNGKMKPEEISSIAEPIINNEADYVTGSRYIKGGSSPGLSLFRQFGIPTLSVFYSFLFGRKFSDISCGFRSYKIDFLFSNEVDINQSWLNRYEMEYYIHFWACKKKLRIKEVPVTILYNHLKIGRKSKIRPLIGWWSILRPLFYLKFGIKK